MEQQSNSKLGTAALIIGLVSATSFFMLIVSAGAIIESTPWGMDEKSATTMVRILLYAVLGLSLLALVLGLAGLFQTERKKTFAIIGAMVAAVTIFAWLAIISLGRSSVESGMG